jgi:carbonic anhydrase/acetyltransferase-like protein (isoleucine patch superfamily)
MLLSHRGKTPLINPSTYVAPTATICGDVKIGPNCRIMHGACLIAEAGSIQIATNCIILENAVIRSTSRHSTTLGNYCLVGPNAHLVGCIIEDEVFIATGAAIFHGAILGVRSEVRVNGVVHVRTKLQPDAVVPIGWVAVGDPASILPPNEHENIWAIQEPLDFPLTVYGIDRSEASMRRVTDRMAQMLASHIADQEVATNG